MEKLGMIAAILLPLWNIPLIVRIIRRRSSEDISLSWCLGVWSCLALMAPSGFVSKDPIWRVFNVVNFVLFSFVVITVVIFHHRQPRREK